MGRRCFTCCIVILIIALLIGGAVAFVAFYVPDEAKLVEKFTAQGLNAVYVGTDSTTVGTEEGMLLEAAIILAAFMGKYAEVNFTGIVYFVSSAEDEEEPETYGMLLFTDSVKTAGLLVIDYYTEGSDMDLPEGAHASMRGKAFFIGNMNGEMALRKIIF